MDNDYFVIVDGESTPVESPQQVAEALIRARANNQTARFLVRGETADREADGREMVEAWLRQLSPAWNQGRSESSVHLS